MSSGSDPTSSNTKLSSQAKHKMAWPDPEISRDLSQASSAVTQPGVTLVESSYLNQAGDWRAGQLLS